MRYLVLTILVPALAAMCGCGAPETPPTNEARETVAAEIPQPYRLWLIVELDDLYNHDFVVTVPVQPDEPFEQTVSNGVTRNTLRGRIGQADGGRHPVSVEVTVRPPAPAGEITDVLAAKLKESEPAAGGPVSSLGISRLMTLLSLPPDVDPAVAYAELPKPRPRVTPPQLPPGRKGWRH